MTAAGARDDDLVFALVSALAAAHDDLRRLSCLPGREQRYPRPWVRMDANVRWRCAEAVVEALEGLGWRAPAASSTREGGTE